MSHYHLLLDACSEGSDRALAWTIRAMHASRDKLIVLTVTELVESNPLSQFEEFLHAQIKFNDQLEKHSALMLEESVEYAREAKVCAPPRVWACVCGYACVCACIIVCVLCCGVYRRLECVCVWCVSVFGLVRKCVCDERTCH